MTRRYEDTYARALADPDAFWAEAAEAVHWDAKWDRVLDDTRPPFTRWFTGAKVNACYNALDRHVENGRADQAALIYDSPVTDTIRSFTYGELRDLVARFAGVLSANGVGVGDRVVIYMPMVPEAAIAMLACARIGAIHSVVFGGFASHELAVRIDDARPKAIVCGSCGIEPGRIVPYKPLLDGAIEIARHKPERVIVLQREMERAELVPGRDLDWDEAMAAAVPADCVPVDANHPLYILYTSGTTGQPKGVVRDTGGSIVYLNWSMKTVYGVEPGEAWWAASDLGWQVGHCYTVYGPLFHGNTSILFEGKPVGTPDAGTFWRVIAQHKVPVLFTAPTVFRAIKREDPDGTLMRPHDLSHFRALFLAGERSDPDTLEWAEAKLGVPVIDHWWQTETGGPVIANCLGLGLLPVKHGSPAKPIPGWRVAVLDEAGKEAPAGETGAIVLGTPMPPGSLTTLWNADARFAETYFTTYPGWYETSDGGFIDEDGYVYVMGRTDDVINVAGHRLSTGAMEEVLAAHPDVAECAVIGAADQLKGQVPLGFVVLKAGVERDDGDVVGEVVALVREKIGPVAAFKTAVVVPRLPKTRSGKVIRGTMNKIADGEPYKVPATIDDPASLEEIVAALKDIGYPRA
jgi:propionyl-CoA synthetase